ncbi:MAG: phage holin family protein [[Eubacterium] sulci]|nr:phage holin family protein [[Eubacterium] sulci]
MNLEFLTNLYIPLVIAVCLVVGYLMKKFLPTDNKYIPLTITVLGAILGCVNAHAITLVAIASGMISGLASTGLHQVFKQILKLDNESKDKE